MSAVWLGDPNHFRTSNEPPIGQQGLVTRRFDIVSRESIRAAMEIQNEEDRNIFNSINAIVTEEERIKSEKVRLQLELEELIKNKVVKTAIMQLEVD